MYGPVWLKMFITPRPTKSQPDKRLERWFTFGKFSSTFWSLLEQGCSNYNSGWWFQNFFIFIPIWGRFPIWRAYFSNGLKPPTSNLLGLSTYKYWVHPTPCNSGWYTIYSFYWMGPILIITFHPHTGGVCPAYSKKPDAPGKRQGNSHHFEEPKTPVELHLKTWPFWSMFWWGPARISLIQTAPKIRNWMFGNLRTGEKKTTDSFVKVWVCWFVLCGDPQRPSIEVRQCNFAIRSDANGGFLIQ